MLVGKHVILRTARERDLETVFELGADVRDAGDHWPLSLRSEQAARKQFQETGWWQEDLGSFIITDLEGRILGHLVFFKAAAYMSAYELGYRLYRPEDWRKGYMTEAVSLAIAFLFATKPIGRIQATTMLGNKGSQGVLEKCGFSFEGILRQAVFHRGKHEDLRLFAVVRDEAPALHDLLA